MLNGDRIIMDLNNSQSLEETVAQQAKQIRILEKKLSKCVDERKNIESIRDSQTVLFKKIQAELDESKALIAQQNRQISSI